MERVIPFFRRTRVFVFACAAGVFAVLAVFGPSVSHPFMSDDYHVLAALAADRWDAAFFFSGNGKYLIPVTKLLWSVQYIFFGTNVQGYHVVSLCLHLLNAVLVVFFFGRIFRQRWTGLLTGALFALSASHWRTAMWMSAQMKLLAALSLLIALIAFHSWLRTGKWRFFLLVLLAQTTMPFSSALGMELPFVLALLYLFLRYREEKRMRVTAARVGWAVAALVAVCLSYVGLQRVLYAHANSYLLSGEGIEQGMLHLVRAARWLALGLFEGFGHAATGIFIGANPSIFSLHAVPVPLAVQLLPLAVLLLLFLLPKHCGWWKWAGLFAAWTVLLYAPPVLPDLAQGFTEDWFVTRARYFYVPAIPFAALLAIFLSQVRLPKKRRPVLRSALQTALVLFGGFVLISNMSHITALETRASDYTKGFARVRDACVQDMRSLLTQTWGTRVVTVIDEPLGRLTGFDYAGHNVLPSHLADAYLTPVERSSFRFLPEGVQAEYMLTMNGHLRAVSGR